jgi:hypothetical protein
MRFKNIFLLKLLFRLCFYLNAACLKKLINLALALNIEVALHQTKQSQLTTIG